MYLHIIKKPIFKKYVSMTYYYSNGITKLRTVHCEAAVIFDLVSPGSNSKVSFKGKILGQRPEILIEIQKWTYYYLKPRENILWLFGP